MVAWCFLYSVDSSDTPHQGLSAHSCHTQTHHQGQGQGQEQDQQMLPHSLPCISARPKGNTHPTIIWIWRKSWMYLKLNYLTSGFCQVPFAYIMHRIKCNAKNVMYRIQCKERNVYNTMHILYHMELNARNTMHTIRCIEYNAKKTIHSLHCKE